LQPPLALVQEANADTAAIAIATITIVFLILWYLIIETINCLGDKRNWHQVIQRTGTDAKWEIGRPFLRIEKE
jgi:hypothetical protein